MRVKTRILVELKIRDLNLAIGKLVEQFEFEDSETLCHVIQSIKF